MGADQETVAALSTDEKWSLAEGYKIMSDDLQEIVRVCFGGNSEILPRLKKHIEENAEEFQALLKNQEKQFDAMIARLQEYEKIHGHQHVKETQDRALYWWVDRQKYLMDRAKLSQETEDKLLAIKFDFRDDAGWETNLNGWDTRRTT